jgi:ABC-2 type transport system permease protein
VSSTWTRLAAALDNPIIAKDGISRMRSWRAPLAITLYVGLLGAFGYLVFTISVLTEQYTRSVAAQIGTFVFMALAFVQIALISLFAPALAAGSISGERERQTFDVLLVSRVSAFGIVWGKLAASLAYVLLLILTALPLFSAVFLFGGIDFEQFLLTHLLTVMTAVTIGSLSVLTSAVFRRSLPATVTSYALAFALILGTAIAGLLLTWLVTLRPGAGQVSADVHPLLFANPLFALNVLLTQPSGAGMHVGRIIQLLVLQDSPRMTWGPVVQPWVLCVLLEVALSVVSICGAVLLVRGRRAIPLPGRRQPQESRA